MERRTSSRGMVVWMAIAAAILSSFSLPTAAQATPSGRVSVVTASSFGNALQSAADAVRSLESGVTLTPSKGFAADSEEPPALSHEEMMKHIRPVLEGTEVRLWESVSDDLLAFVSEAVSAPEVVLQRTVTPINDIAMVVDLARSGDATTLALYAIAIPADLVGVDMDGLVSIADHLVSDTVLAMTTEVRRLPGTARYEVTTKTADGRTRDSTVESAATPCDDICAESGVAAGTVVTTGCLVASIGFGIFTAGVGAVVFGSACAIASATAGVAANEVCSSNTGAVHVGCEGLNQGTINMVHDCADTKDCRYNFVLRDRKKNLHLPTQEIYVVWCVTMPKATHVSLSCGPYNIWYFPVSRTDAGNIIDRNATYTGSFDTRGRVTKIGNQYRECATGTRTIIFFSEIGGTFGQTTIYKAEDVKPSTGCTWPYP